jgi:hypothetical protein
MKLNLLFKYAGLVAGIAGAVIMLLGIIGFFAGEILSVSNYYNFFWLANAFFVAGIFGMVAHIACRDREKQ